MTDSTMVVLGMTSFALVVVLYVWCALALAAVFRKMGEPTWKAWVPILNVATLLKRGDFSPWLVLLNVVPLFGAIAFVIVFIVAVHRITTAFGRGPGLTVVGALAPVVWASILGWGPARWSERGSADLVDERSGKPPRRSEPTAAYVPLVGGWTPDAADAPQEAPSERSPWAPAASRTPQPTADRGGWVPDAEPSPDPRARARDEPTQEPASQPIVMPFAAPSVSLADVTPSPTDWSPAPVQPASGAAHRPVDDVLAEPPGAASGGAVSDVIDALRGEPAPGADRPRRGRTADAASPSQGDADGRASAVDGTGAVLAASTAASAPDPSDDRDVADTGSEPRVAPWVSPPRRTPTLDAERAAPIADVPLTHPSPETAAIARPAAVVPDDEFPELSEAVSAVAEAPEAGAPRSARTSVSSLYTQSAVPDAGGAGDEDDVDALERTVVTRRKRIPWMLVPPSGAPVALTSDVVILGRRPAPDAAHPDAQLVAITDETRTVSKTHALLQLRGDTWFVTDLDSTNGVLFATLMGTEVEAPRGEEIEAGARFFLGDAEVRLARSDA